MNGAKQFDRDGVPYLTTDQMREVDRAMVEDYCITLMQMMENAGRNLAALARQRFLDGAPVGKRVIILAGKGGNGGGGLVCARRLHNWGAEVKIFLSSTPVEFRGVPAQQLEIVGKLDVHVGPWQDLPDPNFVADVYPDLVIDALLGYSLSGAPRDGAAVAIRWANALLAGVPVLSLDLPSGVDATSGQIFDPAIEAAATMTLALLKVGLKTPAARTNVGELYLADIGVPGELYGGLGLTVGSIFAADDVIRIW